MAFGAQLRTAGIGQKAFFSVRSMGVVTGITLAFKYGFVDVGLGKLYFSVDMAGVTDGVHISFYHSRKIRSVGIMAGTALPLREWLMRFKCFASSFGLLVA